MNQFTNPLESKKQETGVVQNPYYEIVSNPDFKKWFEGSQVIDEQGEPLVVFHSTLKKEFQGDFKLNENATDWLSYGIFFSSDREATRDFFKQEYEDVQWRYNKIKTSGYSEQEQSELLEEKKKFEDEYESTVKTFNCFLNIKNPLVLNNHQELMDLAYSGVTREKLMEHYDGIFIKHDFQFTDQYIVFDPENIKMLPSSIGLHNR